MRRRLPAMVLAGALLAGCGSDDDEPGRTFTVPTGQDIRIAGDEYRFDPENVVVRGVGPQRLIFRNDGALAHNVRLFRNGTDIGGSPTFQGGGEERAATVQLEPGSYRMVCTVGNHEDLGMVGTLEVR